MKVTLENVNRESKEPGRLRILMVSTAERGGGAEISAWNLFHIYRTLGHSSRLAVGVRHSDDPAVLSLPGDSSRNAWARFWIRVSKRFEPFEGRVRGTTRARELCGWIGEPGRSLGRARGHEDFNFPGTWQLLEQSTDFDIVHCFNLHPNYFDLRILPQLSRKCPVVLDLRDAWLLSGHCAHSFACDRWQTGCGMCPDLTIYPAIRRDGTAFNWQVKEKIFSQSRLYVAAPSQWMMDKVNKSMLSAAIVESRVVHTGIDLSVFCPAEKAGVRARLDIPQDAKVLLFAGNGIRRNIWKDYKTMRAAVALLAERCREQSLLFIALGEGAQDERIGSASIRFVPHLKNAKEIASYYQAADVYIHAAAADTFPRSVLEALACGAPVVATAVGGIPEQIRSLWNSSTVEAAGATGIVVPPQDAESMAVGIQTLLADDQLAKTLSENAAADARQRFDLKKQAASYLEWYEHIVKTRQEESRIR